MTPGLVVLVVAVLWIGVLVGLLRLLSSMEQAERQIAERHAQGRSDQEVRRG
jgi:cytochrome c-type biogenesis protein CcmH/NrfG